MSDLSLTDAGIKLNATHLEAAGSTPDGTQDTWRISLHFYRRIEERQSSWSFKENEVNFVIAKKWSAPYWPRLLRDPRDPLKAFVSVDWKRWKAEEDGEHTRSLGKGGEEEVFEDEDALMAPASFPEEEYDDSHLPLLNEDNFASWLEGKEVAAALFFSRDNPDSRILHLMFARLAPMINHLVPLACLDAKEVGPLAKKLQMAVFPQAKLFFANGDVFSFDAKTIAQARMLGTFLTRQLDPGWRDLNSSADVAAFLDTHPKAVLAHLPPGSKEEKLFDNVARRYRADKDPRLFTYFAKVHRPENESDAAAIWQDPRLVGLVGNDSGAEPFVGVAMVKKGEPLQVYRGKASWKKLQGWVYQAQFNILEEITRWNFGDFRRRGVPILYVLLGNTTEDHEGLLASIKPVAQHFYGRISFVYTNINVSGDLTEHLRCENTGVSYAVIEDHVDEYRYCINTNADSPLSAERINKTCTAFIERDVDPDHLRSERPPLVDPGPLFTAVASTMEMAVMDPRKDVVIHFYASFDDKWEETEFALEKLATEWEDVPTLKFFKIDGMKNEKPKNFPDLGYFPATWLFPARNKGDPVKYEASRGWAYDTLKQFVGKHVSFPIPGFVAEVAALQAEPQAALTDGQEKVESDKLMEELRREARARQESQVVEPAGQPESATGATGATESKQKKDELK
eukprot:jgi/Mesvir1/24986/Mv16947-RA.2